MVFKRRTRLTTSERLASLVYPRGGWGRALSYLWHRMRRIPDKPHRIARGIALGVFVSFTPFFGFHFLIAGALAWIVRGNLAAALIATFVGNPLTFPVIMQVSVELGSWMLGQEGGLLLPAIVGAFSHASVELWRNVVAIFTDDTTHWENLARFYDRVFLPYLVGGILPGLVAAVVSFYLALPVLGAYQKRRTKKLRERFERIRGAMQARAETDAAGEES